MSQYYDQQKQAYKCMVVFARIVLPTGKGRDVKEVWGSIYASLNFRF